MSILLLNLNAAPPHLIVMRNMRAICSLVVTSVVALSTATGAAAPEAFPIEIKDGKLAGAGADMIRGELAQAQFILFGEDHGFADSPLLLRAIAREARPLGFKYHVVEVGPLSTRTISETLQRDGLPGLHELTHRVPLGFPFLSLKEDAELASDFLGADSKGSPYLWGIDQEFIGSSPIHLERLVAIAPDESARAVANKLLAEEKDAAAKAAQDKFLLNRFKDGDFDALAAQFKEQAEAQDIIAELKESAAIYQAWRTGHNYENNARRARLLMKNFLARYKSAADPEPKVIFKMGAEHVAVGTTTNNTIDLGTLATSIAWANGKSAVRILFLPMGGQNVVFVPQPGNPSAVKPYEGDEAKEFFGSIGLEIGTLPKQGWALVPLEPIRQSIDTKGINALKRFSRFILLGYDYVITTADAKPATSLY